MRAFRDRYLPLNDKYDTDFIQLTGFFSPDVLYTTSPRVVILWSIPEWAGWGNRKYAGSAEEQLIKSAEFFLPVLKFRTGWTDRVLEPLGFSPVPPVRPGSVRPGATILDHQFVVRPEHCGDFVKLFEQEVIPAADEAGLHLELIARAAGRPTEYVAMWSIAGGSIAYADWRASRSVDEPSYGLPGLKNAWPFLTDLVERELHPAPFSPLGGSQAAKQPAGPSVL
jgi:hypothetical protein